MSFLAVENVVKFLEGLGVTNFKPFSLGNMRENLPPKIHRVSHAGGWGQKCKTSSPKSSGSGLAQKSSKNSPETSPKRFKFCSAA